MSPTAIALARAEVDAGVGEPRTLSALADAFEGWAAFARRYAQLMAQEAVRCGALGWADRQGDLLECAEMIGFEAGRYAYAGALVRRLDPARAADPVANGMGETS